jgi:hypothetical protein
MLYTEMDYRDLKTECAKRGLGGAGKKNELIDKLVADDNDMEPPIITEAKPKKKQPKLRPTDPDPEHPGWPNWDMAGRWIRRPIGFNSWEEEYTKQGRTLEK